MEGPEFNLFGATHLISLALIFIVMIAFPKIVNKYFSLKKDLIAKVIGYLAIFHTFFSPYSDLFLVVEPYSWKEVLPFHMCDFSLIFIAIYLLGGNKFFFNCAFFWGIAGASMALLTPDIPYGFPSMNFLMFFYGHGLILFGVFYAVIALNQRPYFKEINRVIVFTLLLAIPIYFVNVILGEPANFWYLIAKPEGASLMDVFPDPPLHLLVTTPLAIAVFYLIYLPYFIKDKFAK